jgi:hypothetical protein
VRRKPVPPVPDDVDRVAAVRAAVPLVPGPEEDCCARLLDRAGVGGRDEARRWLAFLVALGVVEETDGQYVRGPEVPDREALARALHDRVYGARELLAALPAAGEGGAARTATGADPVTAAEAFDAFRGHVPRWERDREVDWERRWRDRVERLLGWAVLLDLAERVDGGYRQTPLAAEFADD